MLRALVMLRLKLPMLPTYSAGVRWNGLIVKAIYLPVGMMAS